MRCRIHVGEQLRVLAETAEGLQLEGVTRLRPGQLVELVWDGTEGTGAAGRSAWVVSWSVARLGKDGPTYQGLCRWQ